MVDENDFREWGSGVFFVNERLNKLLNKQVGDRLILRMEEPSLFSRDAPLSGERDNKFVTMNEELGGVVSQTDLVILDCKAINVNH